MTLRSAPPISLTHPPKVQGWTPIRRCWRSGPPDFAPVPAGSR